MFDIFYINKPIKQQGRRVYGVDEAIKLCRTRYAWIVDGHNDYTHFDFAWEPVPWESKQTHVWPSQHQEHGGTMLIPMDRNEEVNRQHDVIKRTERAPIIHIKHNPDSQDFGDGTGVRYISDYLGTMRRALRNVDTEYCWITSDQCVYDQFDFTWHPSEWQDKMLHVFPSNEQKFGDTFYVHVPSFKKNIEGLEVLEWYPALNFINDKPVPRLTHCTLYHDDTMVDAVWTHEFKHPVEMFYRNGQIVEDYPTIPLWQERTKTIIPLREGNECAVVPREAKNYLRTQLYDYPWIDKTFDKLPPTQYMDIAYISYDEPEAEKNYETLCELTRDLPNRVFRVHGVEGMENALKEAARQSQTPWVYNVFAKTELHEDFKFDYVPDFMQATKHYIFHCKNMSNGLVYGHMGIIMYHCMTVIEAPPYEELGLDYTVSFPVEVVPVISCLGNFATTPYHAWRTAFRETSKLAYFNSQQPDIEQEFRLNTWCNQAHGPHADWVLKGAQDGVEFFEQSQGDLKYLQQAFRWEWLRQRYHNKYD